jgi:hypothetical protein
MVFGKRINNKIFFSMQQLSIESVPEISLPPCIVASKMTAQKWSICTIVQYMPNTVFGH